MRIAALWINRLWVSWILCFWVIAGADSLSAQEKFTYDDHAKTIFQQRCFKCHNSQKRSSDLDLTNFTNLMQGGSSGVVIEPGNAAGSFLYQLITHQETPEMPPGGTKIPAEEIATIEKWISMGALENQGSKAQVGRPALVSGDVAIGNRPETVAVPPRLSMEPAITTPAPGAVVSMVTSPWAPVVALSAPRQILLYNTQTLAFLGELPFPEGQANVLRFSRTGSLLLAGGGKHGLAGKVIVWDVATGERVIEVGDEIDNVLAADISADHSLIALGGPQKMLRVYSTADGSLVYETKKHTDWITSISFSPDGVLLASGDRGGGLYLWEAKTGIEYLTLKGHTSMISSISWRGDGNVVASGSDDTTIKLWEVENGQPIKSWGAHGAGVTSVCFTRDGRIASCGRDQVAKLWQQDGSQIRQLDSMSDVALAVAVCDETNRLLCGDLKGQVKLWDAADGKLIGEISLNPPTLAERLATSNKALTDAEAALNPLAVALAETSSRRTELQLAIGKMTEQQTMVESQLADQRAQLQTVTATLAAARQQKETLQKELAEKETARPIVEEAHGKAIQAVAALPNDAELKAATDQLAAKVEQIKSRIGELTQLVSNVQQKDLDSEKQLGQMNEGINSLEGQLAATRNQLTELQAQLTPVETQIQTQQQAVAAAEQVRAAAIADVDRWKDEIDFVRQLTELKQQLSGAAKTIQAREEALSEAHAKLAEAQQLYDLKAAEKQSTEQQAAEIAEKIRALRTRK